jgi:hypothetical protein
MLIRFLQGFFPGTVTSTSPSKRRVQFSQESQLTMLLGATFLLTLWYKRYEVQSRMAVFYTAASLSGAFSGLLAFAIEKMDSIAG